MTPDRMFDRDTRTDVDGLLHRAGIEPPLVVDEQIQAIGDSATCKLEVDLNLARMPHRECGFDPSSWTGAALVGTRERLCDANVRHDGGEVESMYVSALPADRATISDKLIGESGFRHALLSFTSLAGWSIDYAIEFLDRLRANDLEAYAIFAERGGAVAVRQMQIAVHDGKLRTIGETGAIWVSRALLDAAVAMMAVIDADLSGDNTIARIGGVDRARLASLLVSRLDRILALLLRMCASEGDKRQSLSARLVKDARALIEAISRFTVSKCPANARCKVVANLLQKKGESVSATPLWADAINDFDKRLASLDDSPSEPAWPEACRIGPMANLAITDFSIRAGRLKAIRGDLIYSLIMSRRLDRIYLVAPWLCAPSASFPLVFGGPLGGIAELFEAARVMEIGHELKRRLFDAGDPTRLDRDKGAAAYATAASTQNVVGAHRRAGFLLAATAISHHMVEAFKRGMPFEARHPIPAVLAERTDYDFSASVTDAAMATTISTTELAQPIFANTEYDRDLPRYLDMTLVQMLSCALVEIFDTSMRGLWFAIQRALAWDAHQSGHSGTRPAVQSPSVATRELVRSMLRCIDAAAGVSSHAAAALALRTTIELDRFDVLTGSRLPTDLSNLTAQGLRRKATKRARLRGARADDLRSRIDRARALVHTVKAGRIDEEALAGVLRGSVELPGSLPVAHIFYPVIWFRPDIDRSIVEWVAQGAALCAAPFGTDRRTAERAREEIAGLEARTADGKLGTTDITPRLVRALIPIFTGLSSTTIDPAHREGLTWLESKRSGKVSMVNMNDQGTKDDVATAAHRPRADDEQDEDRDGRSGHRPNFAIQSPVQGRARPSVDFSACSRIEGCRTDQRRSRRRSS